MPRGKNYVNQNKGMTLQASNKKKSPSMELCFYGAVCNRKDCIFRHPNASDESGADPVASGPRSQEPCMAYLSGICTFTAATCHRRHPSKEEAGRLVAKYQNIRCRYGQFCKTKGCLYQHPAGSQAATAANGGTHPKAADATVPPTTLATPAVLEAVTETDTVKMTLGAFPPLPSAPLAAQRAMPTSTAWSSSPLVNPISASTSTTTKPWNRVAEEHREEPTSLPPPVKAPPPYAVAAANTLKTSTVENGGSNSWSPIMDGSVLRPDSTHGAAPFADWYPHDPAPMSASSTVTNTTTATTVSTVTHLMDAMSMSSSSTPTTTAPNSTPFPTYHPPIQDNLPYYPPQSYPGPFPSAPPAGAQDMISPYGDSLSNGNGYNLAPPPTPYYQHHPDPTSETLPDEFYLNQPVSSSLNLSLPPMEYGLDPYLVQQPLPQGPNNNNSNPYLDYYYYEQNHGGMNHNAFSALNAQAKEFVPTTDETE